MSYMNPFKRGTKKSQRYGANPLNGVNPSGGHTGDDWIVPEGTPVHAAADGIIRNSSWLTDNYMANDWWLTRMGGDTLVLDATDAFGRSDTMPTFIYAHLKDSTAPVGARVKKGQIIGISGNTGTATTGPHCHMETLPPGWDWNNGCYGRVDPELWLTEWPDDIVPQGTITTTPKPTVKKASEMPSYKRVSSPANHRRLAKNLSWFLKDKTGKVNENYFIHGAGYYDIKLFLQGTGLPTGEFITVQFFLIPPGGKPSGYFTERIPGAVDGKFKDHAVFGMNVPAGYRIEANITSSIENAYIDIYGADVATWKA